MLSSSTDTNVQTFYRWFLVLVLLPLTYHGRQYDEGCLIRSSFTAFRRALDGSAETKERRQGKLDAIDIYRIYVNSIPATCFHKTKVPDWCLTAGSGFHTFNKSRPITVLRLLQSIENRHHPNHSFHKIRGIFVKFTHSSRFFRNSPLLTTLSVKLECKIIQLC